MVENLNYLVAPLLLAGFGLPAAYAPAVREATAGVRFAISFMVGVVVFVVWSTMLSAVGFPWMPTSVEVPLAAVSVATAIVLGRRPHERRPEARRCGWDVLAAVIGIGALTDLALKALGSRATSIDFFYFWGTKAVRFANADGFDADYLAWPFSVHAHVPYPPLVPVVSAWGVELAGHLPWRAGLVSLVLWIALAYPIVLRGLRSRLPAGEATLAAGVWIVAISLALSNSYSAGNAEPPLVFFATTAVIALISRSGTFPAWVAPVAVSGIVLTKSEGVILWVLLLVGSGLRDVLEGRSIRRIIRRHWEIVVLPGAAIIPWYVFLIRHDLPLSDAARESVGVISFRNLGPALIESLRHLEAGSGWLAWGLSTLVLALSWRAWKSVLPALVLTSGVFAFLLVYYLHFQGDAIGAWVSWTLPRVSLTALSAALLAAAVASGGETVSAVTSATSADSDE